MAIVRVLLYHGEAAEGGCGKRSRAPSEAATAVCIAQLPMSFQVMAQTRSISAMALSALWRSIAWTSANIPSAVLVSLVLDTMPTRTHSTRSSTDWSNHLVRPACQEPKATALMPRPRFYRLEPERRHQLLDTAGAVFAAEGYAGVSLNRLIEQLGISKGAFYYYFDDKPDLFRAVSERAWELLLPTGHLVIEELDPKSFWQTLFDLGHTMSQRAQAYPWLAGIGQILYNPPRELDRALLDQPVATVRQWLDRLLQHGQKIGVVRIDLPRSLTVQMVAAAGQAADRWFVEAWSTLDADALGALQEAVFTTLRRIVEPTAAKGEVP